MNLNPKHRDMWMERRAGASNGDIARRYGLTTTHVGSVIKKLDRWRRSGIVDLPEIVFPDPKTITLEGLDRNKRMWEDRQRGMTLRAIADKYGLKSSERVRQIVWKIDRIHAYHARNGGCYWGA